MPKFQIDFYANKLSGLAPLVVEFYPLIDFDDTHWQDTTDSVTLYQDTDDSETDIQST